MKKKTNQTKEKEFKSEDVFALPYRQKEEIRFAIVEMDGRKRADIRNFVQWGDVEGLRPTRNGFTFSLEGLAEFQKGMEALVTKLTKK